MTSSSLSYLLSKYRRISTNGKMLVLFSLVFLMLLPYAFPTPAKSSSSQISPNPTPGVSPSVSPDFSITASPSSLTMPAGSTQTSTITATSLNSFTGTVYLSTFSYPLLVSLSSTSLTLASGGTASSTVTIAAPVGTAPDNYTVFVDASGGCSLFHSTEISAKVTGPDFVISAEKTVMALAPGGSDTSKIDLASINGFAGTVSLTALGTLSTSLSFSSIILASGGSGTSTLTVQALPGTEAGNYTVSVDGSSGSIFHSADIFVTVTGPTFLMSSSPLFLTLIPGGSSNSSTITVKPLGSFAGTISLTAAPSFPAGLTVTLPTTSVTLPPAGTSVLTVAAPSTVKPGFYFVGVSGTNGSLTKSADVFITVKGPDFEIFPNPFELTIVAGSSCSSVLTLTGINGFTGNVALTTKAASGLMATLSTDTVSVPGTSTLAVSAALNAVPGFYSVPVNGTSTSPSIIHTTSVGVEVIGPDFSISATPSALTITAGQSSTSTISVSAENGFTGTVALTNSSFGTGITLGLSPQSVTGSGTATLTVTVASGTAPGDFYSIEVDGKSGALTHFIFISLTVVGPDFSLSANPTSLTISAGTSGSSQITVSPILGFTAPVDLNAFPSSFNLNASILPATVTSGSYAATLSVNSTVPGVYTVDVSASSGSLFHDVTVQVTVQGPDFSLSASPSTLTIAAGSSKTSTVSVSPTGGFTGTVDLTTSSTVDITATLSPTSITQSGTSTLTISVAPTTSPGSYSVDVIGNSGPLIHDVLLTVNVASFSLSASPDVLAVAQGGSQTSTITVAPMNGFAGTVALTDSASAGLTPSLSTTSITGSGTSTLTITASNTIGPGSYTVTVTGTSGLLTQTAVVTITVPPSDFTVSASPTAVSVSAGVTGISTITVAPINGFTGTVALSSTVSQTSLACTLTPSIIVLGAGQTSTLSCSSTTAGTYTVTVTGTSGSLTHTATVTYTVANFTVNATPTIVTTTAGASATSTVTVAPVDGFTGTVSLTSSSSPLGLICMLSPASIVLGASQTSTLSCSSTTAATYTVTVTGTSGSLTHTSTVTYTVQDFIILATSPASVPATSSATSTITITALNGFNNAVSLTDTPQSLLSCTAISSTSVTGSGTATLSCSSATQGAFTATITGTSGSLTHSATATFTFGTAPDFTIAATSPAVATVGTSTTSTITMAPLNGFTGTAALTDTIPAYLTCSAITPNSITDSGTASLTCSSTIAGTFAVTVTATSGALTHSNTATFTVTDFTITATSPAAVSVSASATSTITVTAVNGFTGTISLTDSPQPYLNCGNINPTGLTNSGTATVSCSSTIATTYTLTITGTSGSLHHTATAQVTVTAAATPDFTLNASPASVTIQAGNAGTSTVTITGSNGFSGTVTLSATSSPTGPTTSFGTSSTSGGSGTSVMTISVASGVAAGSYTITVQGTSGTQSHTTQVGITVTSAPSTQPAASAPSILGLSPPLFYGLIGILIAIVIGAIVVVIRRKNP